VHTFTIGINVIIAPFNLIKSRHKLWK